MSSYNSNVFDRSFRILNKKWVILILLLLFNLMVRSQSYFPFPTMDNTVWSIFHSVGEPGICEEGYWFEYILSGDTLISGNSYKKVFVQNLTLISHSSGFPGCSHPPVNGYAGAFREDTANKRIYIVFPHSTTDSLIYDFNLSPGDTIYSPALPPYLLCTDVRTLYSIDSIQIMGVYRNKYVYCSNLYHVIEGIGSTKDPFGFSLYLNNSALHCVRTDTSVIYNSAPSTSCTSVLVTNEQHDTGRIIEMYPNPARDKLFVHSNVLIDRLEILDLFSKTLITTMSSEYPMSLDDFPGGMYLVRIIAADKSVFLRKLIIY